MKKRLISGLLCAAMTLSLVACGGSGSDTGSSSDGAAQDAGSEEASSEEASNEEAPGEETGSDAAPRNLLTTWQQRISLFLKD